MATRKQKPSERVVSCYYCKDAGDVESKVAEISFAFANKKKPNGKSKSIETFSKKVSLKQNSLLHCEWFFLIVCK